MNLDSAIFYSNDIEAIIPFYHDTLGFPLEYKTERFISFAFPNGARLGIKNQTKEREVPGYQTAFISVDNIEELYTKHKELGLDFYTELTDNPWGKEYSILDADKNKILFLQKPTQ
jgi:catechol 2,3-dioxygenase-like lactoylglutathione lyase family enzyme